MVCVVLVRAGEGTEVEGMLRRKGLDVDMRSQKPGSAALEQFQTSSQWQVKSKHQRREILLSQAGFEDKRHEGAVGIGLLLKEPM